MSSDIPAPVKAPPAHPPVDAPPKTCEHPYFHDGSLVDKWQPIGPACHFVVTRAALIRWGETTPPEPSPPWGHLPCPPGTADDWGV